MKRNTIKALGWEIISNVLNVIIYATVFIYFLQVKYLLIGILLNVALKTFMLSTYLSFWDKYSKKR